MNCDAVLFSNLRHRFVNPASRSARVIPHAPVFDLLIREFGDAFYFKYFEFRPNNHYLRKVAVS